ncbi:MAG: flagellar biosynthesis protein FlhF [SAR324 cluster bacterium]|nr:flagellar biosynthesis protein FlhF [SAR324 cluster bacterium]
MNLKRYRVNNIQEALQQIKKDLGPDAIIVSTRQVRDGKGAFGLFGKTMLEVTAARDEKPAPPPPTRKEAPVTKTPLGTYSPTSSANLSPEPPPIPAVSQLQETRRMLLPIQQEIHELRDLVQNLGKRPTVSEVQSVSQLRGELAEMKHLLHTMAVRNQSMSDLDLPENLLVLYQQMTFNGMEEKFARRLVMESQKSISQEDLQNFSYVKIFLARMLMKIIKTTNGIERIASRQKIVALVGPTGVGKTTTTAKIASEQMLRYKRKVALITVDTFRIAAVEQLRTYAKIINAPLSVVSGKAELDRAIAEFADYDVIIVDTGGRSQRDEAQMYELKDLFDGRDRVENILVLSSTTKDFEMNEITRKFGEIPLSSVIFTKLDEGTTYGCLFNHVIRFKKPIAFLTTGQKVPEDIEVATKERLVDLLLNISGN